MTNKEIIFAKRMDTIFNSIRTAVILFGIFLAIAYGSMWGLIFIMLGTFSFINKKLDFIITATSFNATLTLDEETRDDINEIIKKMRQE